MFVKVYTHFKLSGALAFVEKAREMKKFSVASLINLSLQQEESK